MNHTWDANTVRFGSLNKLKLVSLGLAWSGLRGAGMRTPGEVALKRRRIGSHAVGHPKFLRRCVNTPITETQAEDVHEIGIAVGVVD